MIHTHLKPFPKDFLLGSASAAYQVELAEACRKKETARGAALFAEQCRHHSALGWTEPRRPKWLDVRDETPRTDDSEHEITDEERKMFCEQVRRLHQSLQHSTSNEQRS